MSNTDSTIVTNRAAFHEYHIEDRLEAGIALKGTEVKSVMAGRIQLKESYVSIRDDELWLFNAHISHYKHGNINNHDTVRTRKLLVHRREIEKLRKQTDLKGMTLVVTKIYWKNGRIKFEIGVAKGKKLFDKRDSLKKKAVEKDTKRQLKESLR